VAQTLGSYTCKFLAELLPKVGGTVAIQGPFGG
jgi:hypothetical protein